MMTFRDVYTLVVEGFSPADFLYRLLSEREPDQSISHREMPTFDQHCRFIEGSPYRHWYIIVLDGEPIGSVYLTMESEIGIAITKAHQGKGYGKKAVSWLMDRHPREQFLANINPKNSRSISMFNKLGFDLIQLTLRKTE